MGNVGFRLEIIVIADEIFHRILREECLEFLIELGCKSFVVGKNQGGLAYVLNDVCHGERLAGTGYAKQRLELFALLEAVANLGDCLGLVAGGTVLAYQFEVCTGGLLKLAQSTWKALLGGENFSNWFCIRIRGNCLTCSCHTLKIQFVQYVVKSLLFNTQAFLA